MLCNHNDDDYDINSNNNKVRYPVLNAKLHQIHVKNGKRVFKNFNS